MGGDAREKEEKRMRKQKVEPLQGMETIEFSSKSTEVRCNESN